MDLPQTEVVLQGKLDSVDYLRDIRQNGKHSHANEVLIGESKKGDRFGFVLFSHLFLADPFPHIKSGLDSAMDCTKKRFVLDPHQESHKGIGGGFTRNTCQMQMTRNGGEKITNTLEDKSEFKTLLIGTQQNEVSQM